MPLATCVYFYIGCGESRCPNELGLTEDVADR